MSMKPLSLVMSCLLATSQTRPATPLQAQEGQRLNLVFVPSEWAPNQIGRQATVPAVLVTNATGLPVPDAEITFEVVSGGEAGAVFPGNRTGLTVRTDSTGRASAEGFRPNGYPGNFAVRATATKAGFEINRITNPHSNVLDFRDLKVSASSRCEKGKRQFTATVTDEKDRPVRWASVVLQVPGVEPLKETDDPGTYAVAFRANKVQGTVVAGLSPTLRKVKEIYQTNVRCGMGAGTKVAIVGAVVGAVVVWCFLAGPCKKCRGPECGPCTGPNCPPTCPPDCPPPIVITPGPPTVEPPR